MGLKKLESTNMHRHYETVGEEKHHIITSIPPQPRGNFGIGTVHHIAWSVPNLETLTNWQTTLQDEDFRVTRSEEHTSELQSRGHLVCRLLLEKKNKNK